MRIKSLPDSIRKMPYNQRQEAMQQAVNACLHAANICPIVPMMAGFIEKRIGVYRDDRGRYWYVSAKDPRDEYLEEMALTAIANWN